MDLIEVTCKYVIWNPTVTLFYCNLGMRFCIQRIWKAVSEQVQYSGVKSTGKTVVIPGHKI